MAHNDNDGDYAEDRGGNRHEGNYISFPTSGVVYKATRKIFPWEPPGAYETEQRMVVPSVYIEALLATAPVPDPEELVTERFMVKCLNWRGYLAPALNKLIDHGLFKHLNEEGEEVDVVRVDQSPTSNVDSSIVESVMGLHIVCTALHGARG